MLSQTLVEIQKWISTPLSVLKEEIRKLKVLFGIAIKIQSLWVSAYHSTAKKFAIFVAWLTDNFRVRDAGLP